jgi:hypothetical protein
LHRREYGFDATLSESMKLKDSLGNVERGLRVLWPGAIPPVGGKISQKKLAINYEMVLLHNI